MNTEEYEKLLKQEQKKQTGSSGNPSSTSGNASAVISPYAAQRDKLYSEYMGRKPFSYDYTADPVYQAYEKVYTDKGKLAMEDTVAQSAALTGGYGNTYGHVAGQQVYDNYMKNLSDIVPDLYSDAYSKYTQEGDRLYNQYTLAAARADAEQERADAEQERAAAEVSAILAAGGTPSDELIAKSGYSTEYVNAMRNYYSQNVSGINSRGVSGASGGSNGSEASSNDSIRELAALAAESVQGAIKGGANRLRSGISGGKQQADAWTALDYYSGGVNTGNDTRIAAEKAAVLKQWYDEGLISETEYAAALPGISKRGNKRVNEVK